MFCDPIARLANISAHLESLQNRGDSILPSKDAAVFRLSVQPLIESVHRARELLVKAREQVEDISYIQQENLSE
jgi:hypothetical protein